MNIEDFRAMQKAEKEKPEQPAEQEVLKPVVEEVKEEKAPEPEKPITYEVDGKELTVDELVKGYLRQSDYTKKTTDVSKLRKEHDEAIKLFEHIQSNPALQEKLKEAGGDKAVINAANQESKRIRELENKIAGMELDTQLRELSAKYSDFNETAVIAEAAKRKTTDLEFVYKALRKIDKEGDKVDAKDIEKIKADLRAEIMAELKAPDTEIPPTMMDGKKPNKPVVETNGPTMTHQEARVAKGMGMTPEEYIKYRDAK